MNRVLTRALLGMLLFAAPIAAAGHDPLPSWNQGESRQALVGFVEGVATPGSPTYLHPAERIAVFDNDGTLWAEKPMYFQLFYALDKVRQSAADHPEWLETEPFASVIKGDYEAALAGGEHAILELVAATHTGMTVSEFKHSVASWMETSRHPTKDVSYRELTYQPMIELLRYLDDNDFRVFIVSGGGIDFVRVFSEDYYGIPPERVVGSSVKSVYEVRDGQPVIVKQSEIDLINDKAGKPVGINRYIGRRPVLAFGNSDGDFEMLEYTTGGDGPSLGLLLHHDDAERAWAYDRDSHVGKLSRGLDEGPGRGWVIVSMKNDWKQVFRSADSPTSL